ncbi:hypothetical protein G6F32_014486 [Rhizopus arrhizus]|nr:hypothetical protein G6F32_014486 [Rhizopus arrhizus]
MRPGVSGLQHLARVHQPLRVQRTLDPPHQRQFDGTLVARQFVARELADAVLGADGAAMRMHAVMHHAIDLALQGQQFAFGLAGRVGHVVMQVAVAQMAEDHMAHAGKTRLQQGVVRLRPTECSRAGATAPCFARRWRQSRHR